jgi:predicted RNA binding protein YcfA (HicA-like mRNA interferase family)
MMASPVTPVLLASGFDLLRSKGSHRIYGKGSLRVTVPFHSGEVLHPKIVKQVLETIEDSAQAPPAGRTEH